MTSTDQNDPLAVYYAEVLAATNRFYAAMDRQRGAALNEHQADQAQAPDDVTATFMRTVSEYEERDRKRRAAVMARVRAERVKAKAQAADETPGPEHGA